MQRCPKKRGCWFIRSGTNIKIMQDLWIPNSKILMELGKSHLDGANIVRDLINRESRSWKEDFFRYHFDKVTSSKILQIHLSKEEHIEDDRLIWTKTPSGKFSAKSVYILIFDLEGSTSFTDEGDKKFWSKFWKEKSISPCVLIFIWRCLNNALPLKSAMARFISNCDPLCPICRKENETSAHLFFECDLVKVIWFGSLLGLRIQEIHNSPYDWITGWLFRPQHLKIFWPGSIILWCVWKARNNLIFKKINNHRVHNCQCLADGQR